MATATKTKRETPSAAPVFKDLDDCNAALLELSIVSDEIETEEATINTAITDVRTKGELALKPKVAKRLRLEKDLEEFMRYHRDEYLDGDEKTVKLTYGELNFRISPGALQVIPGKWTVQKSIDAIKAKFSSFVDTFIVAKESLNKPAIKQTLDDSQLKSVGLQIVKEETFGWNFYKDEIAKNLGNRSKAKAA